MRYKACLCIEYAISLYSVFSLLSVFFPFLQIVECVQGPLVKKQQHEKVRFLKDVSGYLMPGTLTLVLGKSRLMIPAWIHQRSLYKHDRNPFQSENVMNVS
jgi:hypothetical protein